MTTFSRIADLPVEIESVAIEGLDADVSAGFHRQTTVISMGGAGEMGLGEDVAYDGEDHDALQAWQELPDLTGSFTIESFCDLVESLDLFPGEPVREVSRRYRVWAFESAALDLALRQAGESLHGRLGMEPHPVDFVCSVRLGEAPDITGPVDRRLAAYPHLRFKLDPTPEWSDEVLKHLHETGAVDTLDFKGLYEGTEVDTPADPEFYARVIAEIHDVWIEDPKLTPEIDEVLKPYRDRISWDAGIHSVADIDALPFPPTMVNIKPSRLGPLRELFHAYDTCRARGIGMYSGGQFELGPGRGQVQYLASLFHPYGPNDIAPTGYNEPEPPAGLPASPLPVAASPTGFQWE